MDLSQSSLFVNFTALCCSLVSGLFSNTTRLSLVPTFRSLGSRGRSPSSFRSGTREAQAGAPPANEGPEGAAGKPRGREEVSERFSETLEVFDFLVDWRVRYLVHFFVSGWIGGLDS